MENGATHGRKDSHGQRQVSRALRSSSKFFQGKSL
jgi:hypothetical protein